MSEITTKPYGSGASEFIYLDGRKIGDISGGRNGGASLAQPTGTWGSYRFASREDAIMACVSFAQRGYWQNEI